MKSSHELSVPRSATDVWAALTDVDRVLRALDAAATGASLTRVDDGATGSLRCRFGAMQVTYRLSVEAIGTDGHVGGSGVLRVAGREARGDGTLDATVTVRVDADGDNATISVAADLEVTGRAEDVDGDHWAKVLGHLLDGALPLGVEAGLVPPPRAPEPDPDPGSGPVTERVSEVVGAPAGVPLPSAGSTAGRGWRPLAATAAVLVAFLVVWRARRRAGRR